MKLSEIELRSLLEKMSRFPIVRYLIKAIKKNNALNLDLFSDDALAQAISMLCEEFRTTKKPIHFLQLIEWLNTQIPARLKCLIDEFPTEDILYWIQSGNEVHLDLLKNLLHENLENEIRENEYGVILQAVNENRIHTLNWIQRNYPHLIKSLVMDETKNKALHKRINSSACTDDIRLFFLQFPRYFENAAMNEATEQYIKNKLDQLKTKILESREKFDLQDPEETQIYYYLLQHLLQNYDKKYNDDIRLLLDISSINGMVFQRKGEPESDLVERFWSTSNIPALTQLCRNRKVVSFSHCQLGSKSFDEVSRVFQNALRETQALFLRANQLNQFDGATLKTMFAQIPSNVTYLSLDINALGSMELSDLSLALTGLPKSIRYLSLKNCQFHLLAQKDLSPLSVKLEQVEELVFSEDEMQLLSKSEWETFINVFPKVKAIYFQPKSQRQQFFAQGKDKNGSLQEDYVIINGLGNS